MAAGKAWLAAAGREVSDKAANELVTSQRVGLAAILLTIVVFVIFSLLFPDRRNAATCEGKET